MLLFVSDSLPFLSAYEGRQHTKRQQISSRSWFSPSSSTPSGSAVGNLLNKLGQKGREAAATKALNTTPCGSLVRRRSDGGSAVDNPSLSSCSIQESVSCPNVAASGLEKTYLSSVQDTFRASTEERAGKPAPEVHCGKDGHSSTESSSTKSLVADYTDSDSDSSQ